MRALLAMAQEEEQPRLYSKQPRIPVDVVAPQHEEIHSDLERWGSWNRDRYQPGTCSSIEKRYDSNPREVRRAIVALPTNPRNHQIDRVVRSMSIALPQHAETLKLYYVTKPIRRVVIRQERRVEVRCTTAEVICHLLAINWQDFERWIFDCRAMVVNITKEIS